MNCFGRIVPLRAGCLSPKTESFEGSSSFTKSPQLLKVTAIILRSQGFWLANKSLQRIKNHGNSRSIFGLNEIETVLNQCHFLHGTTDCILSELQNFVKRSTAQFCTFSKSSYSFRKGKTREGVIHFYLGFTTPFRITTLQLVFTKVSSLRRSNFFQNAIASEILHIKVMINI